MFGPKKVTVHVDLSEETKLVLARLEGDLAGLREMLAELVTAHSHVIEMVKGEITLTVGDVAGTNGVQAFEEEEMPQRDPVPLHERKYPSPPGTMSGPGEFDVTMSQDDPNRVRNTPFTRAPRSAQVTWLLSILADEQWHAAIVIAREVANDERHYRYLKHAVAGRFKEMHEDGLVIRRDSHVKGSMYEYRSKEVD